MEQEALLPLCGSVMGGKAVPVSTGAVQPLLDQMFQNAVELFLEPPHCCIGSAWVLQL